MKVIRITTDTDKNFRLSSDQSRCINSFDFLTTTNFEEGVKQFNKLAVEADLYLIDYTFKDSPIYTRVATKTIKKEISHNRILQSRILKNLNPEFPSICESEQNVRLFMSK